MNAGDAVSWNVKGAFTVPRWHRFSCNYQEAGPVLSGTLEKINRTRALVVSKRGIVWSVALSNLIPSPNGRKSFNMAKKTYTSVKASSLKRDDSIKLTDGRIVTLTYDAKPSIHLGMVILKWGDSALQYCQRNQNDPVDKVV